MRQIPGITVPLTHLPLLVLSLFVSQVIHEAGHAICAAVDATPIQSIGASFTLIVPAAFVALPMSGIRSLVPRARARIAAAGSLHNLVLGIGRVVLATDADSPLADHLPVGAVITKLDDASLGGSDDVWTTFLAGPPSPTLGEGWCINTTLFLNASGVCCDGSAPASALACFSGAGETHCVDPIPLLGTKEMNGPRCSDECAGAQTCVRPRAGELLLRILVRSDGDDRVVLWRGPRVEVWEQVEVDIWRSRWGIMPQWLPKIGSVFFEYLNMLTLSLYIFNLLPLPFLDGSEVLEATLEWWLSGATSVVEVDLEGGMRDSRGLSGARAGERGGGKKRIRRGAEVVTIALLGGCALLVVVDWFKHVS
ncbi:hypothetical protein FA95DRAFT_74971 [Auriscalpium vulgare]|uniref:Uncharacterized protein n=1 Tax=Auriscalpium vulgare TaxID=40419 RepID=A0ACB8RP81_9AGAM|nr:hypothetical protein FA95DRAFT_74971 [Auriscalpium vulgare]